MEQDSHSELGGNHDGRFEAEQLSLYVHGSDGMLIGGLLGTTHSLRGWLDINALLVVVPLPVQCRSNVAASFRPTL
jgi:hypothetical protein